MWLPPLRPKAPPPPPVGEVLRGVYGPETVVYIQGFYGPLCSHGSKISEKDAALPILRAFGWLSVGDAGCFVLEPGSWG